MNRPINDALAPKSRVANNPRFLEIWERLQKNLGEILNEAYHPTPAPNNLSPYAGTVRTCIADLNELMFLMAQPPAVDATAQPVASQTPS